MKVMGQLMAIFEIISLGCDDYVILELFMYSEFWHQFRIESTILDNWSDRRIWWC